MLPGRGPSAPSTPDRSAGLLDFIGANADLAMDMQARPFPARGFVKMNDFLALKSS